MSDVHSKHLSDDQVRLPSSGVWAILPIAAAIVGVVGLGGAYLTAGGDLTRFFASYLFSFMFFLSIGLGGLFFVLLHYATRAGWSVVIRRVAENAAGVLPVMAVLFIPIAIWGVHEIYHWAHFEHEYHQAATPEEAEAFLATDEVLASKLPYLNMSFWLIRVVIYFAVWIFLAWYFRRRSVEQDLSGDKTITRALQWQSAPGILAFALTLTFAAFDWLMALNPHWFSTIFGVYYFAGTVLAIYAFLTLTSLSLRRAGILKDVITYEHYHDLGKMLFAFTVFWTYIAFSQYMLYWYANLPEETGWFEARWQGPWETVSTFLVIGHFAVPFFFMMSRHIKRRSGTIAFGAIWILLMHLLDMYWLVMPTFYSYIPGEHPVDVMVPFGPVEILAVLGIGGLFLAGFAWNMRRAAIVPIRDPRLPESLAFENF